MTHSVITMTEDEFDARYPLRQNHLNPHASWAFGGGGGCLFETCGEELDFVQRQEPRTIWTLVDGDDGDHYLLSGFHAVNRIGYLLSTVPVPEGTDIQVRIPAETHDDDSPEKTPARQDISEIDINRHVHQLLAKHRSIAAIWCIEDMKGARPHLTDEQAWEVLEEVGRKHDAEWGINWTTLEQFADELFPQTTDE